MTRRGKERLEATRIKVRRGAFQIGEALRALPSEVQWPEARYAKTALAQILSRLEGLDETMTASLGESADPQVDQASVESSADRLCYDWQVTLETTNGDRHGLLYAHQP